MVEAVTSISFLLLKINIKEYYMNSLVPKSIQISLMSEGIFYQEES